MTNNTSTLPSRERSAQYLNEATILKPADVNVHTDEWPCFALKEAVVYRADRKVLANLLHAELDGPFVVHGELHLDKGQRRNMISSYSRGQPIEISDVREFSFDDTGNIWAKGVAGWFEVQPAPQYTEIYKTMVAGVNLYFFVTDLHSEQTGKKRRVAKLDVPSVVDAYIERKLPSGSSDKVTKLLKSNGAFLLSMMRKPQRQVQWKRSNLYNWLIQELPDVHSKFNDLHAKQKSKTSSGNPRKTKSRSPESNAESATGRMAGKRKTRNDDDPATSTPVTQTQRRTTRSGKTATLRLKGPPLVEGQDNNLIDANTDEPRRKIPRTRESQTGKDEADPYVESEESTSESEEDEEDERHKGEDKTNGLMLSEEELPTLEPQGPDGQWICSRPECGYLVHNADEDEGQELIKEHYEEHAVRTQEQLNRIKLVKQESRPHLSVSHLLEKLQRLGEDEFMKETLEINGKVVQPRIKRESIMM